MHGIFADLLTNEHCYFKECDRMADKTALIQVNICFLLFFSVTLLGDLNLFCNSWDLKLFLATL